MAVNDNFVNRTLLSGLAPNGLGSNIGATPEVGEPFQSGITNSVWWSWTAPNDGTFTIDTKNSDFDTFLSVFTGSAVNNLTLRAYNDDETPVTYPYTSLLTLNATAGTTYQIAVDGYGGATGNIQLKIVPLVINGTPNSDNLHTTAYPETINGLAGNDVLYGEAGNDILNGNDGGDVLYGGAGNDILNGNDGGDVLIAGTGNDILNGNDGDDVLLGEDGNDTLTGGTGRDQFVFDQSFLPAAGVDTITDFGVGSDTILLGKRAFSSLETSGGNTSMGGNLLEAEDFWMIHLGAEVEVAAAGAVPNEIVYNSVTGHLFYNPNNDMPGFGSGGGQFATVDSFMYLSKENFRVIF
jgi:Ca2+-binding RTX toxin-like protein